MVDVSEKKETVRTAVASGEIFQLRYREGDPVWYVDSILVP